MSSSLAPDAQQRRRAIQYFITKREERRHGQRVGDKEDVLRRVASIGGMISSGSASLLSEIASHVRRGTRPGADARSPLTRTPRLG